MMAALKEKPQREVARDLLNVCYDFGSSYRHLCDDGSPGWERGKP